MIYIPVSVGELIDKSVILEIKIERVQDERKRWNCIKEYNLLENIIQANGFNFPEERMKLKEVNENIWAIEDVLRRKELKQTFDEEFVLAVRSQYKANDERSRIKRLINTRSGSHLIEEKEYANYSPPDDSL